MSCTDDCGMAVVVVLVVVVGPSSNLKRISPQSDSDWGRLPL